MKSIKVGDTVKIIASNGFMSHRFEIGELVEITSIYYSDGVHIDVDYCIGESISTKMKWAILFDEFQLIVPIKILRKGKTLFVRQMLVSELDKSKCSPKFLSHEFTDNKIVNVKCIEDGTLDLRGKKQEYRIIIEDKF